MQATSSVKNKAHWQPVKFHCNRNRWNRYHKA